MRVHLPEIAQYSPYYPPLNVLLLPKDQTFIFYFLPYSCLFNHIQARCTDVLPLNFVDEEKSMSVYYTSRVTRRFAPKTFPS